MSSVPEFVREVPALEIRDEVLHIDLHAWSFLSFQQVYKSIAPIHTDDIAAFMTALCFLSSHSDQYNEEMWPHEAEAMLQMLIKFSQQSSPESERHSGRVPSTFKDLVKWAYRVQMVFARLALEKIYRWNESVARKFVVDLTKGRSVSALQSYPSSILTWKNLMYYISQEDVLHPIETAVLHLWRNRVERQSLTVLCGLIRKCASACDIQSICAANSLLDVLESHFTYSEAVLILRDLRQGRISVQRYESLVFRLRDLELKSIQGWMELLPSIHGTSVVLHIPRPSTPPPTGEPDWRSPLEEQVALLLNDDKFMKSEFLSMLYHTNKE